MTAAGQAVPTAAAQPVLVVNAAPQSPLPPAAGALTLAQQVINQVETAVQQGRRSLRLQLNPKELGAIEVRLVSSGGAMSVTLTADKAATGSLLEKQLEDLRSNLANAGVHQVTVNVGHQPGSGQQGGTFSGESAPPHYSQGGKDREPSQNETELASQLYDPGAGLRIDYRI